MIKPPYTKWINDIKTKLGFNRTMTASGEDVVDAVNKQSQQIGNLTNLETTVKTDIVSAINENTDDIDEINSKIPTGYHSTGTEITQTTGIFTESGLVTAAIGYAQGGYLYFKINNNNAILCNKESNTYGQAYSVPVFKGQSYSIEKTAGTVTFYPYTYN